MTESVKTTVDRFIPLWQDTIAPAVNSGRHVIITAHDNSLRLMAQCCTVGLYPKGAIILQCNCLLHVLSAFAYTFGDACAYAVVMKPEAINQHAPTGICCHCEGTLRPNIQHC